MKSVTKIAKKAQKTTTIGHFAVKSLALMMSLAAINANAAATDTVTNTNTAATAGLFDIQAAIKADQVAANKVGIKKVAYSFANSLGAYGKKMVKQGWTFVPTNDISQLPNNGVAAVVYINANDANNTAALAKKLAAFNGTVVVDSNVLVDTTPNKMLQSKIDSPVADVMRDVLDAPDQVMPLGTAIMHSKTTKKFTTFYVGTDQTVNGFADKDSALISPLKYALLSKQASEKLSRASFIERVDKTYEQLIGKDGVIIAYNLSLTAYRDAMGTPYTANKYVRIDINTGTSDTACFASGWNCGVYPYEMNGKIDVDNIYWDDRLKSKVARVKGPIASFWTWGQFDYTSVVAYTPTADSLNTSGNKDTYEEKYDLTFSKGWNVGANASLGDFLGAGIGFSSETSITKEMINKTNLWNAYSGLSSSNARADISINRKDGFKARSNINIPKSLGRMGTDENGTAYNIFVDRFLNGCHFQNPYGEKYFNSSYKDKYGAFWPRMSLTGWRPTSSITFKLNDSTFFGKNFTEARILKRTLNGYAGIGITRGIYHYQEVTNQYGMFNGGRANEWGYRALSTPGHNNMQPNQVTNETSTETFHVPTYMSVPLLAFNN